MPNEFFERKIQNFAAVGWGMVETLQSPARDAFDRDHQKL